MTNYERIKNMSIDEMANELCHLFDNGTYNPDYCSCDHCVANGMCSVVNFDGVATGMKRWLERES